MKKDIDQIITFFSSNTMSENFLQYLNRYLYHYIFKNSNNYYSL